MISEVQAFLQAIIDEPEDDGLRLIFADWLEENGSPLGEFIRVQIELSEISPWHPRRPVLEARELELLRRHGGDWYPERAGRITKTEMSHFQRGFVDELTVRGDGYTSNVAAYWEWTPFRLIRIHASDRKQVETLADWPFLERARALSVGGGENPYLNRGPLTPIFESPYLNRIRALVLVPSRIKAQEAQAFLKSFFVDQLTTLRLTANPADEHLIPTLIASPRLGQLETFEALQGYNNAQVRQLVECELWENLTSLLLPNCQTSSDTMRVLVNGPLLKNLVTLNLQAHQINDPTFGGLFESTSVPRLAHLNISNRELHSGAMRAFAKWPAQPKLRSLNLSDTALQPAGATALAEAGFLSELESLDLSKSRVGDDGVRALSQSRSIGELRHLNLFDNSLTDRSIQYLVEMEGIHEIASLDLSANTLGPEAIQTLASSGEWSNLTELKLNSTQIGNRGVLELLRRDRFPALRKLHLDSARLGNDGVESLCKSEVGSQLTCLDLGGNRDDTWCTMPAILELSHSSLLQDFSWGNELAHSERSTLQDHFGERWRPSYGTGQ